MKISLDHYRVFYYVVHYGSFSKAAEALFVSQSAVSQSIRHLEKRLGFPLLKRTTKKISATPNGQSFYEDIKRALHIIQQAQTRLINQNNPYSGQLTIGSTDTLCKYFLLDKIRSITQQQPNLKIKIVNATSLECLNLLKDAQIDLAVVNFPKQLANIFVVEKSYIFQDQFVMSKNSLLPTTMTLQELAKQPMLLLDAKSVTRQFLNEIFAEHSLKIEPEIELQNIDLLAEMVQIGLGISFLPDLCLQNKAIERIQTNIAIPTRQFGILSLANWPLSNVANYFIAQL